MEKFFTLIKPGSTVYVAEKTLRGPIANSILKYGKFVCRIRVTDAIRNQIQTDKFPNFNLATFEQYSFDWPAGTTLLQKFLNNNQPDKWIKGTWGKSDLHY